MTSPTQTKCWVLTNKPSATPTTQFVTPTNTSTTPTPDGHQPTFTLTTRELPSLGPNQVLVKTLFISNDPAQRTWIDANLPADRLYTQPVAVGDVMVARGIGSVIESTSPKIKKGDHVTLRCGWSEYVVLNDGEVLPISPLPAGLSETHYLGALGLTGLTAYFGLVAVAEAKKGERVLVSGAAGATGSMVVQIAKKIIGASHVIGIAGGEGKCRFVEKLGADICLDYKSPSFVEDLRNATKDGIDVYFDNVGGEILDEILSRMSRDGRIAACGAISGYNGQDAPPLRNWFNVISMRLHVRGFIVLDFLAKFPEALVVLKEAIADGRLSIGEENETIVSARVEDIPKVWLKLFQGGNTGKLITAL